VDESFDEDQPDVKPAQRVAALLHRAESLAHLAQSAVEAESERVAAARAALAGGIEVAARRARWLRAKTQLDELDATSAQHADAMQRVAAARRQRHWPS
jgi:hypothetical protein